MAGCEADPTKAGELKDLLRTAKADVVLNLAPQVANTLLHDGHDWKAYDKTLPVNTAALLEAVEAAQTKFLVLMKLYIKSFKLRLPYFAGSNGKLANWLHFEDAAKALALVAEHQPTGEVFNIVDGTPVWFGNFIDHFAEKLGFNKPGHILLFLAPITRIIIKLQQMELLDLSTTVKNDKAREQLGWTPCYNSYREGFEQTLQ